MGFGFVEYRKPEQAQQALKQLQVKGLLRWGPRSHVAGAGAGVPSTLRYGVGTLIRPSFL